jgi:hypothetical protein
MSINGIGGLLKSLDDRLRAKGYTELQIARIRWGALAPLAARMGVTMPPYLQADAGAAKPYAVDELRAALEDCYAFALRSKHMTRGLAGERGWDQIIRFCERGGCKSSPLRDTADTDCDDSTKGERQ